ncbi:hypothetical protein E4T42_00997 [Aureobasidium subglaciale]|uniref:Hydrophobin n=1 Tax=Aureobasidium subglaciale (strain EXF-2481) TaxID=1043005 RepID=A0A074YPP7_AURSE|nr:uncharacterized protein AUEXF2481DRAFT_1252 [Aureobasidium subglaciale EXF-2481]KAI5204575.1 hypothetical protein E4T38_04575 [Aureobasidium subglaciale]KAI5223779.1 hypothetical protein E4T40_04351 [Aureobasidium subglaciale]KAI5227104.1 hypothetical protein E4T41_04524 [Aureobasidium subglaciale]KAI5257357.1 hypothetical protein E4T42_00997 [Aureobasidium subglaciale]KAI5262586.1 hypothetical protein E4T46_04410 [Aureobasidium subglaciale]
MKVFASILAIAAVASAAATPDMKRRSATLDTRAAAGLCGPLDTPMCCATDVLGVADLACTSVPTTVNTTTAFTAYCADQGKQPECCVLSLLNSAGLLCSAA